MSVTIVITTQPQAGRTNPFIRVLSQYNERFVAAAKALGGEWYGGSWNFTDAELADVQAAARAVYGTDGPSEQDITELYARLDSLYTRIADTAARFLSEPILATRTVDGQTIDIEPSDRCATAQEKLFAEVNAFRTYGARTKAGEVRPEGLTELYRVCTNTNAATTRGIFDRKLRRGAEADAWKRLYETARIVERAEEDLAAI